MRKLFAVRRSSVFALTLILLFLTPSLLAAPTQLAKLLASDGESGVAGMCGPNCVPGDRFGRSVAVSGSSIVVGATHREPAGNLNRGAAYVFTGSGATWTEQQMLTASDAIDHDLFGTSVDIDGDTIIVGAERDDTNAIGDDRGSAYVFVRSGGVWTQQAKLTAADPANGDLYGGSVAVRGETAVVGAIGRSSRQGVAYVYERSGTAWSQVAKLTVSAPVNFDQFGISVDTDGNVVVIGADGDEGLAEPSASGSAFVFLKPGGGWANANENARLRASDAAANDHLGYSVAISGDVIAVGSYLDDASLTDSGSAYVYVKPGGGWSGTLTQTAKLTASDASTGDNFGVAVAIDGDTILAGAYGDDSARGAAYEFKKPLAGWANATEGAKLVASDGVASDLFGNAVAVDGNLYVIGAFVDDQGAQVDQGSAYVFSGNTPPTITANAFSIAKGSSITGQMIGTAGDADSDQATEDLVVTVNSATVNGVTLSNIATASDGTVTADVAAACDAVDPATFTLTVTDDHDATGTDTLTVTVTADDEDPVISCPVNQSVNNDAGLCSAVVNVGTATATDNCPIGMTVVGVRSDNALLQLTDPYPVGVTTITWTATDAAGNTDTCQQTVTVTDNEAPVITINDTTPSALWPPNHKMWDVTLDYDVADNCGVDESTCVVTSITSNEPVNGTGDGNTEPDWEIVSSTLVRLRAERKGNGEGREYTITIRCTDIHGNHGYTTTKVYVDHNITSPQSGATYKIGSSVDFSGRFNDARGKTHKAVWSFDDATVNGTVTEPSGSKAGLVKGRYTFKNAGVYVVGMTVTNSSGISDTAGTVGDTDAYVVVYDPKGGYVNGGGWFQSPAGAVASNPATSGKVTFAFQSKYFKSAANPKGETQIGFRAAGLVFSALNYQYLAINGARADYRGSGKVNGAGGYEFILSAIDGALDGSGKDKIRLKIWDKGSGLVVYDSQPGASDAALPTTVVGNSNGVVIKK